jgi:hypothetical protein
MMTESENRPAWHGLLAPLPSGVAVVRRAVGTAELRASAAGAAIAGWEEMIVELSAGEDGLRVVQVTCDATGRAISVNDMVMRRAASDDVDGDASSDDDAKNVNARAGVFRHETLGGRIEPDGNFRGTYWTAIMDAASGDGPGLPRDMVRREPTADEVAALMRLVADVERRAARI